MLKKPLYPSKRGLTLIEMLISIAVSLIVGAGLIMIFLHASRMLAVSTVNTTVSSAMNISLERIGRDIEAAQDAQVCPGGPPRALGLTITPGVRYVVYRCRNATCNEATPDSLQRYQAITSCDTSGTPATVIEGVNEGGVVLFDFTIGVGSPPSRVDVRLKVRRTTQGYSRTAEIISIFRLRGRL